MKSLKLDILALCILFLSVFIFFLPLLYPTTRLFVTPGYTNSDIFHLNYPFKEILSQSFKHLSLPVWSDLIGSGFPLIGESQIQAFSLINIFLFTFFPMPLAYNLGYVVCFLILALSMYLVAKQEGFSVEAAFFCAFIFTFSGFNIVRIQHYNILLIFCYLPLIFITVKHTLAHPRSPIWLCIPFLISQSILSGHLPTVFSFFIFFVLLIVAWWYIYKPRRIPKQLFIKGFIIILLSLGLSSIQLVPTFEFFTQSSRNQLVKLFGNPSTGLTLKNIVQFVLPYYFGDIRRGTYMPSPHEQNFWEPFNYIGIIPLALALGSLLFIKKKRKIFIYWILVGALFFLSLEGNSPLAILYTLPPLSAFRVYTRFLIFGFFFLVLLAGFTFDSIQKYLKKRTSIKRIFTISIIFISMLGVWRFAVSFNPVEPADKILEVPKTAKYLKNAGAQRIYSFGSEALWMRTFLSYGWKYPDRYTYLANMLNPNINVLFNIPQSSVYSGFTLRKHVTLDSLIHSNIDDYSKPNAITLSNAGTRILELLATDYIVSPYELTNPEFTKVFEASSPYKNLPAIGVYHLKSAKPLYYIAHRVARLTGLRELEIDLRNPSWGNTYDAIVDNGDLAPATETSDDRIVKKIYTDTKKLFTYTSTHDGFFLLSTYRYPGWQAFLDGKKVPIYSGNIYAMAVFAPSGTHSLEFTFVPMSLYIGGAVTGLSILVYGALVIVSVRRKRA